MSHLIPSYFLISNMEEPCNLHYRSTSTAFKNKIAIMIAWKARKMNSQITNQAQEFLDITPKYIANKTS